jgi:hypothetical protein
VLRVVVLLSICRLKTWSIGVNTHTAQGHWARGRPFVANAAATAQQVACVQLCRTGSSSSSRSLQLGHRHWDRAWCGHPGCVCCSCTL